MLLACSHAVIATEDVSRAARFFQDLFQIKPHFENDQFCEFVLPSRFRIAFFKVVGATTKYFRARSERGGLALGLTVRDIDAVFQRVTELTAGLPEVTISGPPKEHPWGEKSFLMIDPDGNRWEIAQSPTETGELVNR